MHFLTLILDLKSQQNKIELVTRTGKVPSIPDLLLLYDASFCVPQEVAELPTAFFAANGG